MIGSGIDRIKINVLSREQRDGRVVWIKRRRVGSGCVVCVANAFFKLADNPVVLWPTGADWQRWEVESFRLLNGPTYEAAAAGARSVEADELPGNSVCSVLSQNQVTPEIMSAAGAELRRAHGLRLPTASGAWSHGDPHLGNFIFDPDAVRCRLIDFEVAHRAGLPEQERHAEDLLAPLLDLSCRVDEQRWAPLAMAFLDAYGRSAILARLYEKLVWPAGMGRIWWRIRTGYYDSQTARRRLAILRSALNEQRSP